MGKLHVSQLQLSQVDKRTEQFRHIISECISFTEKYLHFRKIMVLVFEHGF